MSEDVPARSFPYLLCKERDVVRNNYAPDVSEDVLPGVIAVPQIVAGSRWDGYTRAPRNWPRESEFVTRSDRVDQGAGVGLSNTPVKAADKDADQERAARADRRETSGGNRLRAKGQKRRVRDMKGVEGEVLTRQGALGLDLDL